jgi:REP element-mobilizing transposase RayT
LWFASKNVRNGLVFDTKVGQQVQPFVGTTFSRPQHLVSPPTAPVGATAISPWRKPWEPEIQSPTAPVGAKAISPWRKPWEPEIQNPTAPVGATASDSMGRTYTSLTYHLIFSTKYRLKTIRPEFRERLYQYIGGIIREKEGVLLEIGGIEDHIHIMAGIPPTILVSDMLKFIKSNSSGWVNETIQPTLKFAWQPGYGAFTVSHSQKSAVQSYIQNQEQHHQKKTFQDEFIQILVAHGIEYDPKFVFEEEHHG